MRTRKTSIIALVALLVVALVGTTIAYWSQTNTIENPFNTGKLYGSTIVEKFTPKDGEDWQPGATVDKEVTVKNEGDTDIVVRAKLTETWTRRDGSSTTPPYVNLDNNDVYEVHQNNATDGLTTGDKSVVHKNFDTVGKWTTAPDTNGWYYYKENLAGGAVTDPWLKSVQLDKDIDMGLSTTTFSVAVDDPATKWYKLDGTTKVPKYVTISGDTATVAAEGVSGAQAVKYSKLESKIDSVKAGYSDSDYVLTVTVETVQATKAAVDAVFGGGTPFTVPTDWTWTLGG